MWVFSRCITDPKKIKTGNNEVLKFLGKRYIFNFHCWKPHEVRFADVSFTQADWPGLKGIYRETTKRPNENRRWNLVPKMVRSRSPQNLRRIGGNMRETFEDLWEHQLRSQREVKFQKRVGPWTWHMELVDGWCHNFHLFHVHIG